VTKDPFVVRKCDLLVFRPDLFLPENRPLPINTNRTLRVPGGSSLAQSERSSWVSYYPGNKMVPFLKDSSGNDLSEFDFKSLRRPEDSLSVFSLLVNANSKLQNAKQGSDSGTVAMYAYAVKATVDAIFHVPEQVRNPALSPIPPGPSLSSAHYPSTAAPGSSTKPRGDRDDLQGQNSADPDHQGGDVAEEDHANLDIDFEEPDFGSEYDDEPDTINGLTFPEMRTVLQRVSDGNISGQERTDAAMLMLGMAGGGRLSPFGTFYSSDAEHQAVDVRRRSLR
jgi:hypothetical protein